MKKVILALVILAVIVYAGYYRAVKHKEKNNNTYERGMMESKLKIESLNNSFKLLLDSIKQQEIEVAESLWQRDLSYRKGLDSLEAVLNEKDEEITFLKTELQEARPHQKISSMSANPEQHKVLTHEQILSYYRKRCRGLPEDLSQYEKRVALSEIRYETARKFSISLQEFDKIRDNNKLDP